MPSRTPGAARDFSACRMETGRGDGRFWCGGSDFRTKKTLKAI